MSGGEYRDLFIKTREMANEIKTHVENPHRLAFAKLMYLVADAVKQVDCVDSGDSLVKDEQDAIKACFGFLQPDADMLMKATLYDELKGVLKEYLKI